VPSGLSPADSALQLAYYVRLLEENGERALVESMIEERRRALGDSGQQDRILRYMSALAALGGGKYDSAAYILENDFLARDDFIGHVNLAQAYLGAGRLPEAETLLRRLANSYTSWRAYYGIESVKLHYYLGLALEQMKRPEQAIEQYRVFIGVWENAQPVTASLTDARRRLEYLLRTP
jgi:tetratricopeptide (TPR) repeat protein